MRTYTKFFKMGKTLTEINMKSDLKDPKTWIPKEIFESYCGEKSEKLLSFYDKAVDKGNMNSFSINWLAILLLPAWLGYRRQWEALITITVIFAILPFVEVVLSLSIPNTGLTGGLIVIGLLANSLLLMNAQKEFNKLKQSGLDNNEIKSQLKDKVSPSVQYAVFSVLGYVAIVIGSTILADVMFGLPY